MASSEGWPGSGTQMNPYLIQGYEIDDSSAPNSIRVDSTSLYVRIQNCYLHEATFSCIYIANSRHLTAFNNTCNSPWNAGIYVYGGDNITVSGNTCIGNAHEAIEIHSSYYCLVSDNLCNYNDYGIYISFCDHSEISNNTAIGNGYGILVEGSYWIDIKDNVCRENFIIGMELTGTSWYSRVSHNNFSSNVHGLNAISWIYSLIDNNTCINSGGWGMLVQDTYYSTISDNVIRNNTKTAGWLGGTVPAGLVMYRDMGCALKNNFIAQNDWGGITAHDSDWCNFTNNEISDNSNVAFRIEDTSDCNRIWNNSMLFNNGTTGIFDPANSQASDNGTSNWWNTSGSPHGYGNFWSDWKAPDADTDGIVDNPYNISGSSGAKDHYPLTTPPVSYDFLPPATSISLSGASGLNGWNLSDVTITLTAIDSGSGVDYTNYRINSGSWQTYAAPFSISADGTHTVHYYSVDLDGNTEATKDGTVKIDKTAPTATASGYMYNVTLSASDNADGSGVNRIMYRIDSGIWQTYSVPFSAGATGLYNVTFYAVDNAGNVESTKWIMTPIADTTKPSTSVAVDGTLGSNGWYNSSVTATLTATDDAGGSGVNYTKYRINGGSWLTYSTPIVLSTDGSYLIEFNSTDDSGNVEATKSIAVKIDKAAPTSTASKSGSKVILSSSDATSGSGVNKTLYRINGGSWLTYTAPFNVTASGNNTIEYYSIDEAGNAEGAKTIYVDNGGGGGGIDLFGLAMVILIIAIIAAIGIPAILWMRRRAKESDSKAPIKDIGTAMAQMEDDAPKDPGKK
jgi:parallel beta-helix repeat protein